MKRSGIVFAALVLCVVGMSTASAGDVSAEEFFAPCLSFGAETGGPEIFVDEDTSVEGGTALISVSSCDIYVAEDVHLHIDDVFVGGETDDCLESFCAGGGHPKIKFDGDEESSIHIEDSEFWASGFAIYGFEDIYVEDSLVEAGGVLIVAHEEDADTVIEESEITAHKHMIIVSLAEDDARVLVEDSTLQSNGWFPAAPPVGLLEWMEGTAAEGGLGLKCDPLGGGKIIVVALSGGDSETQIDNSDLVALSDFLDTTTIEDVNLEQITDQLETMGLNTNVALPIDDEPARRTPPAGRRSVGPRALENTGGSSPDPIDHHGITNEIDILGQLYEILHGGIVVIASAALDDADMLVEGGNVIVPSGLAAILALAVEEAELLVDNESYLVARAAAIASAAVEDSSAVISDDTEVEVLGIPINASSGGLSVFLAVALSLEDAYMDIHESSLDVYGLLAVGALALDDAEVNVKRNDFFGSYLAIYFAFSEDDAEVDFYHNDIAETFMTYVVSNEDVKVTENDWEGIVFAATGGDDCETDDNSPDVPCVPF